MVKEAHFPAARHPRQSANVCALWAVVGKGDVVFFILFGFQDNLSFSDDSIKTRQQREQNKDCSECSLKLILKACCTKHQWIELTNPNSQFIPKKAISTGEYTVSPLAKKEKNILLVLWKYIQILN